tara:strand:+ start:247 stop:2061 length:1815 start_codon:yes stop_codon:yes gene_type:complete
MKNKHFKKLIFLFLIFSIQLLDAQSLDLKELDKEFMESLPDDVRDDVTKEIERNNEEEDILSRRPSTKLSKLDTVKEWEEFKKRQNLKDKTERYGLQIFSSMQSSFMPLNEPNFGNNYIVDYGDIINIQLFGSTAGIRNTTYITDVKRDGTVVLEDLDSVSVAGLNFEQVVDLIKNKYSQSFIGLDVAVTLAEIRDINVLVTGNVEFPGIYTLSGNSNILQALNVSGGPKENGSLRNIVIKRKNQPDIEVDLYEALIFGDVDNIPYLMSGDSINIRPVNNLVRAGYGFNNVAVFEMKNDETIEDLIKFSGGLNIEAANNSLKLVRFNENNFKDFDIKSDQFQSYKLKNLDSIYAFKEDIGAITISGDVKYPGNYSISSSDRLSDILERAGGYIKSAYPFGASLYRESTKELETMFVEKAYRNLITYIATNPGTLEKTGSGSGEGIAYILSEIKDYEPVGRVIADFDLINLKDNLQSNIYLQDGDSIHIPSYESNIYIFGEVGNPGSILFKENATLNNYIDSSGGFTKFSSKDSIFIVAPNGETQKIYVNGLRKFISQNYDIFPGSVIYVPRDVGKVQGLNFYATVAPIFSSLALSIASLNSIND